MTKLRKAFIAATAGAVMAAFFGAFDGAQAGPAGMRQMQPAGHFHRGHVNRGHFHHGRHYGGGYRGYGGIAAGIVGLAIVSSQIAAANQHREMVERIRYERAASARVRKAPKKPPVVIAKTRDCELVAKYEQLVKSAEATLETDKRMNAQYGEDVLDDKGNVVRTGHSSAHVKFQQQEVERLREELRKAKAACGRQAAR